MEQQSVEGILFPPKTPAARYSEHYSRYFNTVELNATHYALPAWSQIEKWLHSVPRDFRFAPNFRSRSATRRSCSIVRRRVLCFLRWRRLSVSIWELHFCRCRPHLHLIRRGCWSNIYPPYRPLCRWRWNCGIRRGLQRSNRKKLCICCAMRA
ncbi:MAG: DUF72 domain-containing protein [Sphingobacteriales bacterium]|nr:DUF72 domain-containing protein [Sphingobacteriales bacterium]